MCGAVQREMLGAGDLRKDARVAAQLSQLGLMSITRHQREVPLASITDDATK